MKFNKGFTLIELLVVIAIIGILSSVVLASLTTARTKGKDAAVQSQMSSMRAQGELFYSTTGGNTYGTTDSIAASSTSATTGLFDKLAPNSLAALVNASIAGGGILSGWSSATGWSVFAQLPGGSYYCVDNNGNSGPTASTTMVTGAACK